MIYVSKSTVSRRLAALAAVMMFASPNQALASQCAQQWSKFADVLVEFGNSETLAPVIARSLADGGCRVSGVELPFDRRTRLSINSITWSGHEMDRVVTEGLPPRNVTLSISGLSRKSAMGMPGVDAEIDKYLATLSADVALVAHWDEEARQASLDLLSIRMAQGDYITARAVVDNVDFGSKTKMQMSAGGFSIPNVNLEFETFGTFEKLLADPFGSALWGRSEDRAERVATMEGNVDLLPPSIAPPASLASIMSFFIDTPSPKGAVHIDISASPGIGPVRFLPYVTGLSGTGPPDEIWSMLRGVQIKVRYPAD